MFNVTEKEFATREKARAFRRSVHAHKPAVLLKEAVKTENGNWIIPGLKHPNTLVWKGVPRQRDANGKIIVNV